MLTAIASPRFVAIGAAPRYGTRDEIIGSFSNVIAMAETMGWLNVLIDRAVPDEWTEVQVHVVDTVPRSEWSPEIAAERARWAEDDRDLPF